MHYESGTETAKKIRAALRRAFPGQTFSVRSSADSVSVSWEDGPFVPDVEDVLHAFQSYETRRSNGEDRREAVGYGWEGRRIVGAQYLRTSRRLSAARRARVAEHLAEQGVSMQDATKPLLLAAEREIIKRQTHSVLEQMEAWEAAWSAAAARGLGGPRALRLSAPHAARCPWPGHPAAAGARPGFLPPPAYLDMLP